MSYFKKLPAPTVAVMRAAATRMLTDVAALPSATPLLRVWVADKEEWARLRVRVAVEKDIRTLYGNGRSTGDFEKREAKLSKEIKSISKNCEATSGRGPQRVGRTRRGIPSGGRDGRQWRLLSDLARTVTNAEEWLSAAVQCEATEDAVSSFSWRLLESDEAAAVRWLRTLRHPSSVVLCRCARPSSPAQTRIVVIARSAEELCDGRCCRSRLGT